MKYDARKISTQEQHLIRKLAVQRVFSGESAADITRSFGLGNKTIFTWLKVAGSKGIDALAPKARSGRNRLLSQREEQEVKHWVIGGDPRQHGFDFGLWTRQIVSELLNENFGIEMSLSGVGKLLRRLGLTPQKPLRRAYERDEEAVKTWITEVYPRVKKHAKNKGAEIFWLDEASIPKALRTQYVSRGKLWGRLSGLMIPCNEPGAKKGSLPSSKPVVNGNRLTRFRPYRIRVGFGTTFIRVNLRQRNVLSASSAF